MDSSPVNWEAFDALIIDFVTSENLFEDASVGSETLFNPVTLRTLSISFALMLLFFLMIIGFCFSCINRRLAAHAVQRSKRRMKKKRTLVPALNMRLWYASTLELPDGTVLKGGTLVAIRPTESKKEVSDISWVSSTFEEPYETAAKMLVKKRIEMNSV